ncbi:MAG: fluoride efflux transporter CrcB [Ilumatobacteraceae bacterium]
MKADPDSLPRQNRGRQIDIVAAVGLGGALGTLARYAIAVALPVELRQIPWSTLIINLSGSFLIGIVMFLVLRSSSSRYMRPFLVIGVLGGFTTFSTFAVESVQLVRQRPLIAVIYLLVSVIGGALSVLAGSATVGRFLDRTIDRPPARS